MFDLITFWFNVSTITISMVFPLIFVIRPICSHIVYKITDSLIMKNRAYKFILEDTSGMGDMGYKYQSTIFNTIKVPIAGEGWVVCIPPFLVMWVIIVYMLTVEPIAGSSLVEVVSVLSLEMVPYTSVIVVLCLLYFITIFVGKRFWKMSEKIKEVLSKVDTFQE